ncbi:MAG: ferritin-like domain-containing protein [Actinobacteria bacterium]|nr:ferritin-like domain-containing protein [Actinomycetota bacterium]MCA1720896.1 ferritin-like domain-containing protein [Actinomycetota bacterium]
MSTAGLLKAVVEAEHAAVYGYGVLGARLDDATRRIAVQAYDVHRARRDRAVAALGGLGVDAPVPLPAYDVTVTDRAAALALAVRLEEGVGQRWRDVVGGTDDAALRQLAIGSLAETAVRAARWRRLAGVTPVTVALPGT